MELYSSVWHIISAMFIFFGGATIAMIIGQYFSAKKSRSLLIYFWHTMLCLVYCWYVIKYGGDATGYFRQAQISDFTLNVGSTGVTSLAAIFVQLLDQSFLGTFLIFNIFGGIGLLAFDACLRIATQDKAPHIQRLATLIIFLPSVSFWSSAIGKDSLSFMATGLALWAAMDLGRRAWLMAFAVVVMLLVRPHMAGMMVMGLTLATLLDARTSLGKKLILGSIALAVAAALVPFALRYAGVGETVSAEALTSYVEQRQSYNMEGGSGVDIASMSLPMQLFTYMFRPLVFEAHTVFALAAAFDNLILLYLFIAGGWALWQGRRTGLGENRVFMWSYALLAWATLAVTTANLGIAVRQKWMFTPMLILLFISVIGQRQRIPAEQSNLSATLRQNPLERPKIRKP